MRKLDLTPEQKEFVRNNPNQSMKWMAKQLKCNYNVVRRYVSENDLEYTNPQGNTFNKSEKEFIHENYGKINPRDIAKALNRPPRAIYNYVYKQKQLLEDIVEQRPKAIPVDKYYDLGWADRLRTKVEEMKREKGTYLS